MRFNARARCQNRLRKNGALYGGLIFAEHSKRCVSLRQAQENHAPLRLLCFEETDFYRQNSQPITSFYAVQLHGAETEAFITALRQQLPKTRKSGSDFSQY